MKKFGIKRGPSLWEIISIVFGYPKHNALYGKEVYKRTIMIDLEDEGDVVFDIERIEFPARKDKNCDHLRLTLHGTCRRGDILREKKYPVIAVYSPECENKSTNEDTRCEGKGHLEVNSKAVHHLSVLDMF